MKIKNLILLSLLASCSTQTIDTSMSIDRDPSNFRSCFETLNLLIKPSRVPLAPKAKSIGEASSLEELEEIYGNRSFVTIQSELTQEQILDYNKKFIDLLDLPLQPTDTKNTTSYVTLEEAKIIYKDIDTAKVNVNNACYDPTGKTGFCFGRATMVHMEALVRGMAPEAVRKIWVTGDLSEWGHHVATLIKAEDGWYVIDVEVGKIVKVKEWFKFFKKYQKPEAKEMMLFVSKAERFGPHDTTGYRLSDLFNTTSDTFNRDSDFYRGFFHDYFEELDVRQKSIKKFPTR